MKLSPCESLMKKALAGRAKNFYRYLGESKPKVFEKVLKKGPEIRITKITG